MNMLERINLTFSTVVFLLYSYQLLYLALPFLKKSHQAKKKSSKKHKYGIVIAARNEAAVIGQLIESVWAQNYPKNLIEIFVVADNCTDDTAAIARNLGAHVWERHHKEQVGKGYALDFLFKRIQKGAVDAFIVFDADNLLSENYLLEMNETFSEGHSVITSYRNSKNYGSSWVSAGQSLWFLKESQYINRSRSLLNSGCAISGTGFLVSASLIEQIGGWPYHTLVEDIEFSVVQAIAGNKIAYCEKAIFFDEQPVAFSQSVVQRLRWSKGFYQVFFKYKKDLVAAVFAQNSFYAFDMLMKVLPIKFLAATLMLLNLLANDYGLVLAGMARLCAFFFLSGLLTLITEWRQIHAGAWQKISSLLTFPFFVFTFIPIAFIAAFAKIEWKPIVHQETDSLALIRKKV